MSICLVLEFPLYGLRDPLSPDRTDKSTVCSSSTELKLPKSISSVSLGWKKVFVTSLWKDREGEGKAPLGLG